MLSKLGTSILNRLYLTFTQQRVDVRTNPGMVSFTFDDFPASALEGGGAILEQAGWRGTYYTAMGLLGTESESGRIASPEELRDCAARGHEIANHTLSHLNCVRTARGPLVGDVLENFRTLPPESSLNFAYPFGATNTRVIRTLHRHIATGRGVHNGINASQSDPKNLKANPVYSGRGLNECLALVDENAATGGWLIFYTHDVQESPSEFGCTPQDFTALVDAVRASGMDVVTVEQGRQRLAL